MRLQISPPGVTVAQCRIGPCADAWPSGRGPAPCRARKLSRVGSCPEPRRRPARSCWRRRRRGRRSTVSSPGAAVDRVARAVAGQDPVVAGAAADAVAARPPVRRSLPFPPFNSSRPAPPPMRSLPRTPFEVDRSPASPRIPSLPLLPVRSSSLPPPRIRSSPAFPLILSRPEPPKRRSSPLLPVGRWRSWAADVIAGSCARTGSRDSCRRRRSCRPRCHQITQSLPPKATSDRSRRARGSCRDSSVPKSLSSAPGPVMSSALAICERGAQRSARGALE